MTQRSKVVELSGHRFQVRKLPPEVGSFVFMRMLGVTMRTQMGAPPVVRSLDEPPAPVEEPKPTAGEDQVRTLSFLTFTNMAFEDFKFVQGHCMRVIGVMEDRAGTEFAMPIMTGEGAWTPAGEPFAYNPGLVSALTTEVMVFCFADFFDKGGSGLRS